jgi:hypothetical protein
MIDDEPPFQSAIDQEGERKTSRSETPGFKSQKKVRFDI